METQPLARELPRLAPAALEALARASGSLPPGRSMVNAVDIVLAVLGLDGAGARVVEVVAPGRLAEVEAVLAGGQAAVPHGATDFGELDMPDGSVVYMDVTAREVVDGLADLVGRTADTKDLLLAESRRQSSVLVDALATLGIGGDRSILAPELAALAKRVGQDPAVGGRTLVFRPLGTPPSAVAAPDRSEYTGPIDRSGDPTAPAGSRVPPAQTFPATAAPPAQSAPATAAGGTGPASATAAPAMRLPRDVGPVIDLAARPARAAAGGAAEGSAEGSAYLNSRWAKRVLAAMDRNALTVLVTDSQEMVDEMAAALAQQLAHDQDGVFGVRAFVALEPGYLATQPANALRDGIRAAAGGVLYLPNIPRYLDQARSAGGSLDLRRALARGDLRVLGTLADRDVGRLWPPEDSPPCELVFLEAAGIDETKGILESRRQEMEQQLSSPAARIRITDAAIDMAARVADRYYRDPPPPGGAIRLLREAATAIKVRAAAGMGALQDDRVSPAPELDPDDVLYALERLTGIKAQLDDQAKLLGIEAALHRRVVGQDQAITALADAIRRARAGLKDPGRPIGTFIFMGPSGVGKTELARALAEFLFDDENAMVRLDMSEYHERHTISRLIGAPPGYVGYDEGGQLTEPIRRKPYQIVLFDEIEKAHPDVHNALLQIMEDGRLTDSRGRTVDFRNTVIIMTGNVGSEYFRLEGELGREKVEEAVREEARQVFRPEFLGRVDDFIIFRSLGPAEMRQIVDLQLAGLNKKLGAQGLSIVCSEALCKHLAEAGYAPELGARPLRGQVRTLIEQPLARLIIQGTVSAGQTVAAELAGDGTVAFSTSPAAPEAKATEA